MGEYITKIYKENYVELNNTVLRLKNKVINHEERINNLEVNNKEEIKEKIFFDGEEYDSYSFITKLIKKANKNIILIDNYIDIKTLDILSNKNSNVSIEIITKTNTLPSLIINNFIKQYGYLIVKKSNDFHDRFLIIDNKYLYHIGASLKNAGSKCFAISGMSTSILEFLKQKLA